MSTWWFSADRNWHQGEPPAGWWRAPDGRWHPPVADLDALADASKSAGQGLSPGRERRGRERGLVAAGDALGAVATARIRPRRPSRLRRRRLWGRIAGDGRRFPLPWSLASGPEAGKPTAEPLTSLPRLWPGAPGRHEDLWQWPSS